MTFKGDVTVRLPKSQPLTIFAFAQCAQLPLVPAAEARALEGLGGMGRATPYRSGAARKPGVHVAPLASASPRARVPGRLPGIGARLAPPQHGPRIGHRLLLARTLP